MVHRDKNCLAASEEDMARIREVTAREEMPGGDGAVAAAVEKAVRCLGRGVDMAGDLRLKHCKDAGGCLVLRSSEKKAAAKVVVPGFRVVADVPADVKCGKGDRIRFKSDVLEFNKMSEVFNHRNSLAGKIPSGLFNSCFDLECSSWAEDASAIKCLAFDGYFISLLDLQLDCRPLALADHVVRDVPAAWDPSAIASFIEKYGTHIVVGLSLGGQDVVYVKQDNSSPLSPSEIKEHLDRLGDQLFTGACTLPHSNRKSRDHKIKIPEAFNVFGAHVTRQRLEGMIAPVSCKEGVTVIHSKRGGNTAASDHSEWLLTVLTMPEAINFKLVPITSLLKGVTGVGFLSHAMNLYLRYKPPIEELSYFLDFQHHRLWAPVLGDLPLGPCSNRQGDCSKITSHRHETASGGQEKQPVRHPPAASVEHPNVHRRKISQAAGMARIGDDLRRAVLRAGPVENVRPCLHGAGEVRPSLGQRRRLAGGLRRLRRSAARQGSRLDQHTPPQAPVH
ncbi:MACPF domain-containing protein At1g14780-like isoform X4 [Panicum hallii]|uniref:MACPF domain-containing protein At1g14780-like isoform X4 n=1 Tax=Panicum hallii TaxID=206008 RepID=UPI000DF4E9D5|nr:MACPF domain-containing protein At1g14780-like isoform X4 [Panicum hallii]